MSKGNSSIMHRFMTSIMQDEGIKVQSFDALFGLCRKKHAGASVRPPLFGTTFFEKQDEVDAFVKEYDSTASLPAKVI